MAKYSQDDLGKYAYEIVPQLSSKAILMSNTKLLLKLQTDAWPNDLPVNLGACCKLNTELQVAHGRPMFMQASCRRACQAKLLPLEDAESTLALHTLHP